MTATCSAWSAADHEFCPRDATVVMRATPDCEYASASWLLWVCPGHAEALVGYDPVRGCRIRRCTSRGVTWTPERPLTEAEVAR